jgi:hypothetical protein
VWRKKTTDFVTKLAALFTFEALKTIGKPNQQQSMLQAILVCVILVKVVVSFQNNSEMSGKRRTSRSFRSRSRGRRDSSAYSGMPMVNFEMTENGVFLNKDLRTCSENLGQIIIVDSGCPRSLLGDKELERLKELVKVHEFQVKDEGFRFGPSRVYNSNKRLVLQRK